MRVYLDSPPVIYSVEQVPPFADLVDLRLAAPGVIQVDSELTRMECRVMPIRQGDDALLFSFESYFTTLVSELIPLTAEVMDRAAEIRARTRFRTPDAIHLAAATISGCDLFLTNDRRLQSFTGISIEVIQH